MRFVTNKYFIYLLLLIAIPITPSIAQGPIQSNRLQALLNRKGWIRIGLTDSTSKASVTLPSGGTLLLGSVSATVPAGTISLRSNSSGISIDIPGKPPASAAEVLIASAGEPLQYNGRSYRGRIRVTGRQSLTVINEVMLDDWLKGVLPAEIGSDSPMEALKAQAVAGRSEAIFRLLVPPHKSEGYDFCTGVHCQAYKGIGEENAQIRQACDETLGYVMVSGDDVLNAVYHNVCGGVTAGAEDVWDSKPIPGLSPVFDKLKGSTVNLSSEEAATQFINDPGTESFCYPGNPNYANYAKKYFNWSKTMTAAEAGRAAGVGTLTDIQVTERRPSGRVRKLTVRGTGGTKTIDKELNIRNVFDLWSGLFILKIEPAGSGIKSVTFEGAGNGHGVGLCQHGAREIARRGGKFDQILGHYYRGAKLQKVYRP